jgi:hypothetical protein
MMLAFSVFPTIQVRLPAGTDNQSLVYLVGFVRDPFDCVTEFNLSSVVVISDSTEITNLVDSLQNSRSGITTNPLVQILASGNQNTIGQVISSLSRAFNKINDQTVKTAVESETLNNDFHSCISNCFFRWSSCFRYCCITIRWSKSANCK